MNPSDPQNPLSAALRSWQVNPPRDPTFRPAVLDRIQRRARASWVDYVRSHGVSWFAAAVVAIGTSGWAGHTAAQTRMKEKREQMVVSYLGNLDPRVLAKLRH